MFNYILITVYRIEKYIHIDININEVVLECMNKESKPTASRTGVSNVMKLLSRKTTMHKSNATTTAATDVPNVNTSSTTSSAVQHLTHGPGHHYAHHPPTEGAGTSATVTRKPSLSQRNGFKAPTAVVAVAKPAVEEFQYEPTDSSHSSESEHGDEDEEPGANTSVVNDGGDLPKHLKYRYVHFTCILACFSVISFLY